MNEAKYPACTHSKTMLCGEHYEWCPKCGSIRRIGKLQTPLMDWQYPSYARLAGRPPEASPNAGNMAGSILANSLEVTDTDRINWLEANPNPTSVVGGIDDGAEAKFWGIGAHTGTLRETIDHMIITGSTRKKAFEQ